MQSGDAAVAFGEWDALAGLCFRIHSVRYCGKKHSTRDIFLPTEAPMGEHEYTEPLLFSAPEIDLVWPGCDTVDRLAGMDWDKELARGRFSCYDSGSVGVQNTL